MTNFKSGFKGYYIDVMSDGNTWEFSFSMVELKGRKCRSKVTATCLASPYGKLSTPHDFPRMVELLPIEFWPPFALNFDTGSVSIPQNERLF
jgi:hypothetical protein